MKLHVPALALPPAILLTVPIFVLLYRYWQVLPCPADIIGPTRDCFGLIYGIRFETPSAENPGVFGFAEYVQALALLVVVYTVADIRYQFRIAVAPIPLWPMTFVTTTLVGFGTLFSDLLFSSRVPLPHWAAHREHWQAIFGFLFLLMVLIWIWYAFIRPPVYGSRNELKYLRTLYRYILRGSPTELQVIAAEFGRSAYPLVELAALRSQRIKAQSRRSVPQDNKRKAPYTNDLCLLIGDRKFCRAIIASSPGTAISLFAAMTEHKYYGLPLGQFASNITAEALQHKDSALFHEDEGYRAGFMGYVKPFSTAVYGNFDLVEALASKNFSPLDVSFDIRLACDASQVEAYGRAVVIAFEAYLTSGNWRTHSYALRRAYSHIPEFARDVYKLDDMASGVYESDCYQRFHAVVEILRNSLAALDKNQKAYPTKLRMPDNRHSSDGDMYDLLARKMVEVIFASSGVKNSSGAHWEIQHNTVWTACFWHGGGPSSKIVQYKIRRLIFDEISELVDMPGFRSARMLGVCLNVMGFADRGRKGHDRSEWPLRQVVLSFVKRHYLTLRANYPDVADSCVLGMITFDEENNRFIKTYRKSVEREAAKEYLDLNP